MKRTILAATLVALAFAGCGGGSGGASDTTQGGGETEATPSKGYVRKADAICSRMVTDAARMGTELRDGSEHPSNPLAMTTKKLIEPAIPIVEESSRQLRALKPRAKSVSFESYVNVFDPIMSLLRGRVEAGNAGEGSRAHELELQLIDLSALLRSLARRAGLQACDVDFIQAFTATGTSG
jgi:hypothetical protein